MEAEARGVTFITSHHHRRRFQQWGRRFCLTGTSLLQQATWRRDMKFEVLGSKF
jgi:hypothetical protein